MDEYNDIIKFHQERDEGYIKEDPYAPGIVVASLLGATLALCLVTLVVVKVGIFS